MLLINLVNFEIVWLRKTPKKINLICDKLYYKDIFYGELVQYNLILYICWCINMVKVSKFDDLTDIWTVLSQGHDLIHKNVSWHMHVRDQMVRRDSATSWWQNKATDPWLLSSNLDHLFRVYVQGGYHLSALLVVSTEASWIHDINHKP